MNLSAYSTAQLVTAMNAITGSSIKKFENRQKGEERIAAALAVRGLNETAIAATLSGNAAQASGSAARPSLAEMAGAVEAGQKIDAPAAPADHPVESALRKFIGADERGDEWMRALLTEVFEAGRKSRNAAGRKKDAPRREGPSKRAEAAALLAREGGATAGEILECTGWPSVSVPALARASNLTLRQQKEGRVTRYYGTPA
jgi:hypothetical protein